ncbi:hypothetical protein PRIPAC_86359 [Pristionchus pacificus]|uniref:Uncharacterized protein n=1 Tax=Pristionchus pacificus TaxID=54126 RepID=A0A2A6CET0_PRIPA|nr:hypothetical protein PRIPAC_86359 [Pristionchus pacificus]|eukprot:PDM76639.1 hypothetical protein PRIPAC_43005 [Pristionchus pacificus]
MRLLLVSFLLFTASLRAHAQANREKCALYCGDQKHELTKSECERWDYLYCTKTISRLPSSESSNEIEWDRSLPWRFLASSVPILTLPCLNMDDTSLTILCNEEKCNDTLLDDGIEICSEKFSKILFRNLGIAQKSSPIQCATHSSFDAHMVALLFIIVLLSLAFLNSLLNSFELKRVRHDILMNSNLPSSSNGNVYSEVHEMTSNIN